MKSEPSFAQSPFGLIFAVTLKCDLDTILDELRIRNVKKVVAQMKEDLFDEVGMELSDMICDSLAEELM